MPFVTLNLGLQLTIPTNGTRNWGTSMYTTTWTKISQHGHTGSGDGTKMVTASYTDLSVTSAKLAKNIALAVATALVPAGTTQAIDFNNGNNQKLDLGSASGNVTVSFSNPSAGGRYTLLVVQAATPRSIVWPTIKWANGQAPILSETNDAIDKVHLYYDGTDWYGDWNLAYA